MPTLDRPVDRATVLDWTCPECGKRGQAVALQGDRPSTRVLLSHKYANRASGRRPAVDCRGNGLDWNGRR